MSFGKRIRVVDDNIANILLMENAVSAKHEVVEANGELDDRLEGYAAGAGEYIVKPFEPSELQAKAEVLLRLKSVEELDALKMDVIRLLTHETRTPLNGILGCLDVIETTTSESLDEIPEYVEMA